MEGIEQLIQEYELTVAELKQEQAQAGALFLSIGDGAIATNQDGRINRINQAALDILGLKEDEAIGQWFPGLVVATNESNEAIDHLDRPIMRAFLTGKPVSEKTFYQTKTKNKLPVFVTVSPIMLGGKPIGAIEVFRDISLEYEVDRMKSEFISLASHQLRTPLTAANTYTRMLASGYAGKLSRAQMEYMDTILTSIDRMNEIITALLDISKLESGRLQSDAKTLDYTKLVNDEVNEQAASARNKSIKLTFKPPPKRLSVKSDPLLLKEACANLLSNAIKYTPAGGRVDVSLTAKSGGVALTVKDTGYGIPANEQHRTFTKFFRAPNIINKESIGTGLGLYMVKSIAEALGGKVWFKSQEDKGSTFYFWLPANQSVKGGKE